MSVCSGSALLAKAGLLDGAGPPRTSGTSSSPSTRGPRWIGSREARWVDDGNRVTSSGVSAGIDMALAVVARLYGQKIAEQIADGTEYQWHRDADKDPFALPAK